MATIVPDFQWQISLSHQETRLVLLGLAGMLAGKELEEAKALNAKLRKQRHQKALEYAEAIKIKDDEMDTQPTGEKK